MPCLNGDHGLIHVCVSGCFLYSNTQCVFTPSFAHASCAHHEAPFVSREDSPTKWHLINDVRHTKSSFRWTLKRAMFCLAFYLFWSGWLWQIGGSTQPFDFTFRFCVSLSRFVLTSKRDSIWCHTLENVTILITLHPSCTRLKQLNPFNRWGL